MAGQGTTELLDFLRDVACAQDLKTLGEAILRFSLAQVPKAQAGSILLLNEFSGNYEFVATLGWDFRKLREISFPKEKLVQHRVYGDKPAIIRDILEVDRKIWGEELAKKLEAVGTVKATLTVPLFAAGKLLGYLNLDHKENPDAFSQGDLEKLAGFAEIFAGLLDLWPQARGAPGKRKALSASF
jgi:GAF domain-containing protein